MPSPGDDRVHHRSNGSIIIDNESLVSLRLGKAKGVPIAFALHQNYPNPFNPSTIIRYDVPEISHISVKIFNVLGQEAATLVDELQNPGFRSIEWNASGGASGVYFYRLEAIRAADRVTSFIEIRKMILVK